ncbi:histidine phosphatase family protein [Pseudonocardia endophytica]|uniref:histidine phosphatase family protein n=1 Tax=Pseudonocardia endophytica TaxID=401976 RepID=UPI001FB353F9|nr:histidine phosphatase family protein [Pseudonocardia endophytica]
MPGSTRLTLLVHGSTRATAEAAFPADDALEDRARTLASAVLLPRADHLVRGPERACGETCDATGAADVVVDDDLRGWDAGRWSGRTLDELAAEDPSGLQAWLTDPAAAPHGGESLTALLERVERWLADRPAGHTLAVCGPAVPRAAVVVAMGAPATAFWRVDAAPLTVTDLRGGPSRWTVRATGRAPA